MHALVCVYVCVSLSLFECPSAWPACMHAVLARACMLAAMRRTYTPLQQCHRRSMPAQARAMAGTTRSTHPLPVHAPPLQLPPHATASSSPPAHAAGPLPLLELPFLKSVIQLNASIADQSPLFRLAAVDVADATPDPAVQQPCASAAGGSLLDRPRHVLAPLRFARGLLQPPGRSAGPPAPLAAALRMRGRQQGKRA